MAICEYCGAEFAPKPTKRPPAHNFCKPSHSRSWYYDKQKEAGKSHKKKKIVTTRDYIDRIRRYVGEKHAYRPPKSITEVS